MHDGKKSRACIEGHYNLRLEGEGKDESVLGGESSGRQKDYRGGRNAIGKDSSKLRKEKDLYRDDL